MAHFRLLFQQTKWGSICFGKKRKLVQEAGGQREVFPDFLVSSKCWIQNGWAPNSEVLHRSTWLASSGEQCVVVLEKSRVRQRPSQLNSTSRTFHSDPQTKRSSYCLLDEFLLFHPYLITCMQIKDNQQFMARGGPGQPTEIQYKGKPAEIIAEPFWISFESKSLDSVMSSPGQFSH